MSDSKSITLDDVTKSEVVICPECGVLFVKTVKGPTWGFLGGTKIHCPVCDSFAAKEVQAE